MQQPIKFIFITEASKTVGFGHLIETFSLIDELRSKRESSFLLAVYGFDAKKILNKKKLLTYKVISFSTEDDMIKYYSSSYCWDNVILNTRNNSKSLQIILKNHCEQLCIIDELGNKEVYSDLLFNASVIESWHNYSFKNLSTSAYYGSRYFLLNQDFTRKKNILINNKKNICLTMGGSDESRATIHTIKTLKTLDSNLNITVILGHLFSDEYKQEIINNIENFPNFVYINAPNSLSKIFSYTDVAINAGGNTLYECAVSGIPSIVLYEDEHERIQGKYFENAGAAFCLGSGINFNQLKVKNQIIKLLNDRNYYLKISDNAQSLVDGLGATRVIDIILRNKNESSNTST